MKLTPLSLTDAFIAEAEPRTDHRGRFARIFCDRELQPAHGARQVVQVNISLTRTVGAVRGLHYQHPPCAEAKWVRCLRGRVFDVMVDLRRGSPTFLRWQAVELDGEAMNAVFIPEGFAHGFQVLVPDSEVLYLHTAHYAPLSEGGIRFDEPRVGVAWPLAVTDVSERDRLHPLLERSYEGLEL